MARIRVYTDGACSGNPGPGGWGAVVLLDKEQIKLFGYEKQTTNNRMELMATLKALEFILREHKCKHIDIYSDSAYVVNSVKQKWILKWLKNGWKNSKGDDVKNKDLWEQLIHFLYSIAKDKNTKINMIKVKGHSGDKYNELADELARSAIENI